jgi:hypothetical protein
MDILPTQNHFSAANGNAPKEKWLFYAITCCLWTFNYALTNFREILYGRYATEPTWTQYLFIFYNQE